MSQRLPAANRRTVGHTRVRVALIGGSIAAAMCLVRHLRFPTYQGDLDQVLFAARIVFGGGDPYGSVGPGRPFEWPWKLFYPLPAALVVGPFAALPVAWARVAFGAAMGSALGFAVGRRWRVLWPLLASASFYLAITVNQWSPLVLASLWLPALGFVVAVKPNIGLVSVVGQRADRLVPVLVGAAGLLLLSLALRPDWVGTWMASARGAPNKEMLLLKPGGWVLLVALLAWKQPAARVLLAVALIPHTCSLYELLPLFIVCRTLRQALILSLLTHLLYLLTINGGPHTSYAGFCDLQARLAVPFVMVPAAAMLLWNEYGRAVAMHRRARLNAAGSLRYSGVWSDRCIAVVTPVLVGVELWSGMR